MTLEEFVVGIYASIRDVRPDTLQQYQFVVQSLDRFLGHSATFKQLNTRQVNDWLMATTKRLSPHTVRTRRGTLLSIWNLAAQLGYCQPLLHVRRVKVPDLLIVTLGVEECWELMRIAALLPGRLFGCPRGPYMQTLIRATLQTSLRQSDLHRICWSDMQATGWQIVQRKTSYRRWVKFSPSLVAEVAAWCPEQGPIWPVGRRDEVTRVLRELGEALGVSTPRITHTLLRKTAITEFERAHPGTGWIFAGHKSPETTRRWYTAQDVVARSLPDTTF